MTTTTLTKDNFETTVAGEPITTYAATSPGASVSSATRMAAGLSPRSARYQEMRRARRTSSARYCR